MFGTQLNVLCLIDVFSPPYSSRVYTAHRSEERPNVLLALRRRRQWNYIRSARVESLKVRPRPFHLSFFCDLYDRVGLSLFGGGLMSTRIIRIQWLPYAWLGLLNTGSKKTRPTPALWWYSTCPLYRAGRPSEMTWRVAFTLTYSSCTGKCLRCTTYNTLAC